MTNREAEEVVSAIYRTILLREPDEAGLKAHAEALRLAGLAGLEGFLADCFRSEEFAERIQIFEGHYLPRHRSRLVFDHSQHGEVELLIRRMVESESSHRFIVDVGARGRERSNSYDLLAQWSWRGLLIEANPKLIAQIEEEFAGLDVVIEHAAISDREGEAELFIGVNDDVSSLAEANARAWGPLQGSVKVPLRRLGPVLQKHHVPYDFDVLSLDIEGEDLRVLNDLIGSSPYRPRWIFVEASFNFQTTALSDLDVTPEVRQAYRMCGQTVANVLLQRI